MSESIEERLAAARAARKEQAWVAQRLADARADRQRVSTHLEATKVLVASEQADVDRLARGVGGLFRRVFAGRDDLTREQRELAAAKLQHEALEDERRAIDADISQLEQRAAAVAGADAKYQAVLAEVETRVAAGDPELREDLIALAETDGKVRAARRELAEAVAAGRAAHDALVLVQQAVSSSRRAQLASDHGSMLADDLGVGLLSSTAIDLSEQAVHEGLRAQIAAAQHALLTFQRECKDVARDAGIEGVNLSPMPGLAGMVARDLVWSTQYAIDDVGAEVELLSSYVATTTMELRARDRELQKGQADVLEMRAAILDPARERL